ncbi:MAG: hypothetical protein ACE5KE_00655 [Methanosarcinales archaeon]
MVRGRVGIRLRIEEAKVLRSLWGAYEQPDGTVSDPKTAEQLALEAGLREDIKCPCKTTITIIGQYKYDVDGCSYCLKQRAQYARAVVSRLRKKGHFIFNETWEVPMVTNWEDGKVETKTLRGYYYPSTQNTIDRIIDKSKKRIKGNIKHKELIKKLEADLRKKGIVQVVKEQKQKARRAIRAAGLKVPT